MDWRKSAEETIEELRSDGLEETIRDVRSEYVIDQQELGKIIVITSLALLVVSIPSALTLQSAQEDLAEVNRNLNQVQGVVGSESFQESMNVLQNRISGSLGATLDQVMSGVERSNRSIRQLEATQQRLETRAETYKWLSLISIVGLVAGVTTLFI